MPRTLRGTPAGRIVAADPIDWSHPLNADLAGWWLGRPGLAADGVFPNLVRGQADAKAAGGLPMQGAVQPGQVLPQVLSGSGDYLTAAATAATNLGPNAFTIEATWLFRALPGAAKYPLLAGSNADGGTGGTGASLYYNGDGGGVDVLLGFNGAGWIQLPAVTPVATAQWYRFVYTHQPTGAADGTVTLYVNGVPSNSVTYSGKSPVASGGPWTFGAHYSNPSSYGHVDGSLGSARAWGRCLSAAEVAEGYREALAGYPNLLRRVGRRPTFLVNGSSPATAFKPAWILNSPALGSGVF